MLAALAGCGPSLPGCDDPKVAELATHILRERIPAGSLSQHGEVEADSSKARRVCRAELRIHESIPPTWVKFAVEPHGDGSFFLQFMP